MLLPSGPMQNGITYMVRPRMQPSKISANVLRISAGAIQLLVGPASSSLSEQMNVRSSTRATSRGSEADQKLFGRSFGFSRVKVAFCTSRLVSLCHSSSEPSHQTMSSGLVSSAIPWTHLASSGRLVSFWWSIGLALNIAIPLHTTRRRGRLSRPRSRPGRRLRLRSRHNPLCPTERARDTAESPCARGLGSPCPQAPRWSYCRAGNQTAGCPG